MNNPVFTNKIYKRIYILTWLFITCIHVFLPVLLASTDILSAIMDSLSFNIPYFLMGASIWYIVYFNESSGNLLAKYFRLLVSGIVFVSIWYLISSSIYNYFAEFLKIESVEYPIWRVGIGLLLFSIITLSQYTYIYYENLKEKSEIENELRISLKETELKVLKSQLNPHFLFNSLNSINALIFNDPGKAQEMLLQLSTYLRYNISKERGQMSTIKEEFENCKRYLNIEQVRFRDKLAFEWFIDEECLKFNIPTMLLQPLYENAIKHGVYESNETINIFTKCSYQGSYILIEIENDIDSESIPNKGEGFGLKNVSERLLLNYGIADLIKYTKTEKSFKVEIKIPKE